MFTENVEISDRDVGESRPRGRPRGATPQSEATRRALYGAATQLFARDGYESTTLRSIARAAGVSPGLLYRYFPSKRSVVLELYDELSLEFATRAEDLPRGTWRQRFIHVMKTSLDVLGPHRDTLVALVPALVAGPDEGLFSPATAFSRKRVHAAFARAVDGARDAPPERVAASLARVLYVAHLGVILWWLLDRTSEQRATRSLIAWLQRVLAPIALALRLKSVRALVTELDRLIGEALLGRTESGQPQSGQPQSGQVA